MDNLIGNIADYIQKQAETATEISHGINQIASEELSGEAAALRELVSRFQLKR